MKKARYTDSKIVVMLQQAGAHIPLADYRLNAVFID